MTRALIGKCVALSLLVLLPGAAGGQHPVTRSPTDSGALREAANVLQGVDSTPFLDTKRIRLVARALRTIRARVPQVAGIASDRGRPSLVIDAADSVESVFVTRSGAKRPRDNSISWGAVVSRVGVPAIDSLNRQFDVASITVTNLGKMSGLWLQFRRPMNVPVVADYYARVPQVGYAGPDFDLGTGNPDLIALLPKEHRLHFIFAHGSGDCPAGCINWDYHYVTYDTLDDSVVLEHEILHTTTWAEPISYWDIPTRYSINPYPVLDSLFSGLQDARWWYRQHAVHVLARLLGKDTGPWHGAGEQSQTHYDSLKAEVRARRRASFEALIERLTDRDPDVANLALEYLRQLSGRTLPGGPAGVASWQRWLRDSQ